METTLILNTGFTSYKLTMQIKLTFLADVDSNFATYVV